MTETLDRKQDIFDAALSCFTELGISATTIGDIRKRSGASTGSIYHHFGNKDGLAEALFSDCLSQYREGVLAVMAASQNAEQLVKSAVEFHIEWAISHPEHVRFMLYAKREMSVLADNKSVKENTGNFLGQIKKIFSPQIINGDIKQLPKEMYIPLISGPSQEIIRVWLSHPTAIDLEAMKPYLAQAAWDALCPKTDK